MSLHRLDPIADPRWKSFIDNHPHASVFHTPGWLDALRRTYGYEPVVYTKSPRGKEIRSGQVFCEIDSWVTGRRLVSLPFSDHAAILLENQSDFQEISTFLQEQVDRKSYRYAELRPAPSQVGVTELFTRSQQYYLHRLALEGSVDGLYQTFHKNCVQRKIRRAERERLDYTEGRSEKLVQQFHCLLLNTHRRHGLPPQPISWFCNLAACLGPSMKVRIASYKGKPIAGMVTLVYKRTVVYKYGGSDAKYHRLGGMAFLFWKTIQEANSCGLTELDMGRSDCDNPGLIIFKEHWGAQRSILTYLRYPTTSTVPAGHRWDLKVAKKVFGLVPAVTLLAAGKHLYRHVG